MPADQQRALGRAAQREPLVAGLVDLLLDGNCRELAAQPLARPRPRLRPRHALRACLVPGQLLELVQLIDSAGRLERHAPDPKTWYETRVSRRTFRLVMLPVVLAVIWAVYEGYRWIWETTGWTRPFPVNERTMPHLHDVVGQLFEPSRRNGPILGGVLFDAALFTAKEAFVGLVIGATVGFLLAVLLVHSVVLARGLMPFIVASQTIPILAIAPMVVVGLGAIEIFGWTPSDWQRVSVIAAYLTFFPVTINTVRGFQLRRSARASAHAFVRGRELGDPLEAPRADVAAVRVRRAQGVGNGERRRRHRR